MSARRRIAIVIDAGEPAVVAEAWRAAVGVSLRGAAVTVATVDGSADGGAAATRARATLALFGHTVDGDPDAVDADIVERWRGADPVADPVAEPEPEPEPESEPEPEPESESEPDSESESGVVHLVRVGRAPIAVAPGDRVLRLSPDVDHGRVLDALARGRRVVVW